MPSSLIKKILILITLLLSQWAVLTHARSNPSEADKTEPTAPAVYEPVTDDLWVKSQLNRQAPDYPDSVFVGTEGNVPRDTPNSVYIQE